MLLHSLFLFLILYLLFFFVSFIVFSFFLLFSFSVRLPQTRQVGGRPKRFIHICIEGRRAGEERHGGTEDSNLETGGNLGSYSETPSSLITTIFKGHRDN